MAGAPKAKVDHPLLDRANKIRAHLDAGKLDQADAEIDAAIQEAQTIQNTPDFVSANRPIIEAVLGAYRERGRGLGAHPELTKPGRLEQGRKVAFVRDHMRALLAGQPAPTPPAAPAPQSSAPVAAPTAPVTVATTSVAPSPEAVDAVKALEKIETLLGTPLTGNETAEDIIDQLNAKKQAGQLGIQWKKTEPNLRYINIALEQRRRAASTPSAIAPAPAAAPAAPGKIPDALKAKAHPRAVKIIETVIDLMAVAIDEATLKAKLDEKKIQYGKDDAAKTMTVKNLARALKAIQNHKPPLLQNLETVTEAEHIHNRAKRIEEIFDRCYVNIVFRKLLTSDKKIEKQRGREMIEAVGQKEEAKELIEIIQAIKQSGKKTGVMQLRDKIFGFRGLPLAWDTLIKDPAISQILERAKDKGLNPHRIIQSVDKAEGTQPAANADELHAKVKAVLGRMKEIIKRVKRENGRPAAAPASQPASTPAGSITTTAPSGPQPAPATPGGAPAAAPRAAPGVLPEITSIPEAIINSQEFRTLVEKIKAVRANPTALANAKGLTTNPFMQVIFVDTRKSVMTALKEARRGKPFRTEKQIKEAIEHQIRILDKLLRGEIVGPASVAPSGPVTAPAAPGGAPAPMGPRPARARGAVASPGAAPATGSAPAPTGAPVGAPAAPTAGPAQTVALDKIDNLKLRTALEAAVKAPKDRDLMIRAWELYHKNAEGCPRLKIFQKTIKGNLNDCVRFAKGEDPGDADALPYAIENLLPQLHQELTPDKVKALEKELDEKALREELVGFYYNLPTLKTDMERMLKVLAIDPNEAEEGPERNYVIEVQKDIRDILYIEIPETISADTKNETDPKEKLKILHKMSQRKRSEIHDKVTEKIKEIDDLIEGLPEKFNLKKPSAPAAPSGGPAPASPAPSPIVPPLAGPAVPATSVAQAPVASAPAPRPRRTSHYPPENQPIEREHVEELMKQALRAESVKKYKPDEDPVSKAILRLLQENADRIDMADLEHRLKHPDLKTNERIEELLSEDFESLKTSLSEVKKQFERNEKAIERVNRSKGTAADAQKELAKLYDSQDKFEIEIKNLTIAVQLHPQNPKRGRRYENPREALALIHIYLKQKEGSLDASTEMADIAEEMEAGIEAELPPQRKGQLNLLKPTLEDTLQKLADDDAFKSIGAEKMSELVEAHKDAEKVEEWIESLAVNSAGGIDASKLDSMHKRTIPRLIAYLEFALRGARLTHLNHFSQKSARALIDHLRTARYNYVTRKLEDTMAGKDPAQTMIAYFHELETFTVAENRIKIDLIENHAYWRLAKREALGAAAVGALTGSALLLGPIGFMPVAAAAAIGGVIKGTGLIAETGLGSKAIKKFGKKHKASINRIALRSAVGLGVVLAPFTLGWSLTPTLILGSAWAGKAAFADQLWKHRKNPDKPWVKWVNRGLLLAGTLGLAGAYWGAKAHWSKRKK